MCGRIVQSEPSRFAERLDAFFAPTAELQPRYNIGPMARVLGVALSDGVRVLTPYRWGLLPMWAKDPKMASKTFNARAETVATKPMFRHALRKRRLLVPVDGFYEWAPAEDGAPKQPYFFHRADGDPVVLAGLWEYWDGGPAAKGEPGEVALPGLGDGVPTELLTASVLTTAAGPDMPIHNRQPVILEPGDWAKWLDPAIQDPAELTGLFVANEGVLARHPVSTEVGSIRNQGAHLIDPVPVPG
jgi:putative SOS response-associated peptidase YedK